MHADYATISVQEQLGPDDALDLPWTTFVSDCGAKHTFSVPASDPADAYLEVQAFDVDAYGHEILLNDETLSGFDIPPGDGWQYWMDTVSGSPLQSGENTLHIERDTTTDDAFAIATVVVHWRATTDT